MGLLVLDIRGVHVAEESQVGQSRQLTMASTQWMYPALMLFRSVRSAYDLFCIFHLGEFRLQRFLLIIEAPSDCSIRVNINIDPQKQRARPKGASRTRGAGERYVLRAQTSLTVQMP